MNVSSTRGLFPVAGATVRVFFGPYENYALVGEEQTDESGKAAGEPTECALVDFATEVCLIPQFDPSNPKMISQGPSLCIFNKKDDGEVMASWLVTQ